MILYTPMQLELVLEGFDQITYTVYQEVNYYGVSMLVEHADNGRKRIVKLLSTKPSDYLKSELSPGNYIQG
ncbi:MAG: YlzJ-like family protein [Desulfotomaculaceae bacterium]|nr:YlzJ-like family protein [Desulfotomaculaceae bacterium]